MKYELQMKKNKINEKIKSKPENSQIENVLGSPYSKKASLALILQKCVLMSTLKASRCQVPSRELCVEFDV